jgi:hypothetical protein
MDRFRLPPQLDAIDQQPLMPVTTTADVLPLAAEEDLKQVRCCIDEKPTRKRARLCVV